MSTNHRECDITGMVERHIMVAVDGSDNARRAVLFADNDERQQWLFDQRSEAQKVMDEYRHILVDAGFQEDKVNVRINTMRATSVADCIIKEQEEMKCCTIVIGRRGISKKEEFIFG